jgi:phosphoglycerate dehydrogenase-like enzyme
VSGATDGPTPTPPGRQGDDPLVIGITYPQVWDGRPPLEFERDLQTLAALDPRIEVLTVRYVEDDALRTQRGASPAADLRHLAPDLTPEQREAFSRMEVVLAQDLPFDVTTVAPRLRWVQGMGAGVSQLLSAGLDQGGILLTSAAGVNAVSISEFVLARLLQIWKRLPEIDGHQAEHQWQPTFGREVAGSTLGVVGLGAIGRQVARRGRALGMTVLASRRQAVAGDIDPDVDQLFPADQLHQLLGRCDAVVAAVPESPATVGLFGAAEFASMPAGSVFMNVGRGSAVVEPALIDSLTSGHLRAAAIDVVSEEPLPSSSVLWDVDHLFISPHSATSTDRFWASVHQLFRENVGCYLAGTPLRNQMATDPGG